MNHAQKELALYLADRLDDLEKIPATHRPQFDMGHWVDARSDGIQCEGDCNTAVCAMGFAAMDPKFQKAGLRLESGIAPGRKFISFGYSRGFPAASLLFGISWGEALHVFSEDSYSIPTPPSEVAARLRDLVRKYLS